MFNKPPLFPENTGPQNNFLFTIHKKTNGNTAKELQNISIPVNKHGPVYRVKKKNEYQLRYHPLSSSSKFIYIVKIIFFSPDPKQEKKNTIALP